MAFAPRFPQDVPVLTDGVVTLRAPRLEDAEGSYEQCLDPLSRQWTSVPLEYTRADSVEYLTSFLPAGWREDTEWGFAVEVPGEAGEPAYGGTVSLRNRGEGRAEIAYGSHPRARGNGMMERALRLLLDWGFRDKGLHTVVWLANRGNWASRKLAWKVGFSFDGTVRQWLPQRGELLDAWVGSLLAGDAREPRSPWLASPVISGRGLRLRPHDARDAPRLVEACNDPETRRWLGTLPAPYTPAEAAAYVEQREVERAAGRGVNWAVCDPADDRLLGTVGIFELRLGIDAEVGFWVHPEARGRGVATEACRLALRHAFVPEEDGGLGLGRVRAVVAEENAASRRVVERLGMTLQGRERRLLEVQDGLADAAVYDVLTEEFRA